MTISVVYDPEINKYDHNETFKVIPCPEPSRHNRGSLIWNDNDRYIEDIGIITFWLREDPNGKFIYFKKENKWYKVHNDLWYHIFNRNKITINY